MRMRLDDAPASLMDLIDLEKVEENLYRGTCHPAAPLRAFGGQVAAQALTAAGTTVPQERQVHSLHGYFIRAGRTDRPIVYEVDRTRDGGSFTTRRVVAVQDGVAIFSMSASFHRPEESAEHQAVMPKAPEPESLVEMWDTDSKHPVFGTVLQSRCVGDPFTGLPDLGQGPRQQVWVRARDLLPDVPLLHACALTYMSDIRLALTAAQPHLDGPEFPPVVSLDHAVWFHRPFRADSWLLFTMDSPSYASSRGLTRGQFFAADGSLVASVVQEGLIRKPQKG